MAASLVLSERFEILELIKQGSMGAVYRARDQKTQEIVAVKALNSELIVQDPSVIARFISEGETLRQLNHPNIIRVIDTIEQSGNYYIVMEYLTGGSLEKLLKAETYFSVERVIQIALDLADALTRAHRLKIIHGDIRPANVLLAADGSLRLTDFGVVQLSEPLAKAPEGKFFGTASYLSPEVCNGQRPDERGEIWSFGIMLYEMLSGKNPFHEATPAATVKAILSKIPPDLTDTRTDVPSELAYLIDRMIAKDPQDRIDSVRAVGVELETILAQIGRGKAPQAIGTQEISATKFTPATQPKGSLKANVPPAETPPEARPERPSPAITQGRTIISDTLAKPPEEKRKVVNPRVFLAYRREDTGDIARKIYDVLHKSLGDNEVARDVDRVANRTVNRVVLAQDIVQSFDAMLIIIGQQWMGLPSGATTARALDNPKDNLRIQIEAGFRRPDMLIVPVLVNGASMPTAEELPLSLRELTEKKPFQLDTLNEAALDTQLARLITQIKQHFAADSESHSARGFAVPPAVSATISTLIARFQMLPRRVIALIIVAILLLIVVLFAVSTAPA